MKSTIFKSFISILAVSFLLLSVSSVSAHRIFNSKNESDIKLQARASSVQILHVIPGLKVSFTSPLSEAVKVDTKKQVLDILEEKKVTREAIDELIKELTLAEEEITELISSMVEDAIDDERALQADKYEYSLTLVERYGYESPSKTAVPLGALAPTWAKFPERVLVVKKIEREEISAWEKQYDEDVLAVSETADVSPSKAKSIITTLRTKGYSIFKEEVAEEATVELLWFRSGWEEPHPTTLNWRVCIEGTETNIITGYDPRGILYVRPIPDGKRIYVSAGYLDLKPEFRPKDKEVRKLEYELEGMENKIELLNERIEAKEKAAKELEEDLREELKEAKEELRKEKGEEYKRDISKTTWGDVLLGIVQVEQFWMISGGTGTYLGDMKVQDEELWGFQTSWGGYQHIVQGEEKGVILTNAHVAESAVKFEVYVSEDKEVMWIIYPGYQYVRYTLDSDIMGTPSQVLCYDGVPILSKSMDCAIIVTTKVPQYKEHAAPLGNSDNVQQGDRVVMVGNPALLQKFATEGNVSNKEYDMTKSMLWFMSDIPKVVLGYLRNVSLWIDAPIGIGGTSGSAIWALTGEEQGKVIALHAMGLGQPVSFTKPVDNKIDVNSIDFEISEYGNERQIRLTAQTLQDELFKGYSFEEAMLNNKQTSSEFYEENETFKPAMRRHGRHIDITGMSAGIPINKVKTYLQERGLDPDIFGWEGVNEKHWWK